jgi:epoxide hydrolase-like predicted phosphatase
MTIKNIIFDLGNVIVDIDAKRTEHGLNKLGIERASDIFTVEEQNDLCDRLECGVLSGEEFIRLLGEHSLSQDVDLGAVKAAWESMILQSHPERLQVLSDLRQHYRVFLLSNTNEIHYNYLNKQFAEQHDIACLDNLFDKAYYSFRVGLRKPMPEIYEHVLEDGGMHPEETLFIDDLDKNLEAAKQFNIQTWHAQSMDETWEYVKKAFLRSPALS